MRDLKFLSILFLASILLTGCARSKAVSAYGGDIKSLSAFATFKISGDDWTRRFDAAILVSPPDRFRVEFFDLTGNPVFSAGFDGKRGWGLKNFKSVGLNIKPAELTKILLGEKVEGLEVAFLSYEKHDGISFPHAIELSGLKRNVSVEIFFKEVELNDSISEDRFRRGSFK